MPRVGSISPDMISRCRKRRDRRPLDADSQRLLGRHQRPSAHRHDMEYCINRQLDRFDRAGAKELAHGGRALRRGCRRPYQNRPTTRWPLWLQDILDRIPGRRPIATDTASASERSKTGWHGPTRPCNSSQYSCSDQSNTVEYGPVVYPRAGRRVLERRANTFHSRG